MRLYHKLLILFLTLSIIPVLFIGYISLHNTENSLEKEILSNLQNVADEGVEELETFFSERKANLIVLRQSDILTKTFPILDQFNNDRTNPAYREAKKIFDCQMAQIQTAYHYVDIMLVNKQGTVIYVSNPAHEYELNQPIADKDLIFETVKSGIYTGEILKTSDKQHPHTLYLAGSVHGETDEIIGLVHMEIDMDEVFNRLYGNTKLGKSGEILWVRKTPDNKVLFLSPLKYEPDAALRKVVAIGSNKALPAQKALLGESGVSRSIDYRGKKVLSAWMPIKSFGWGLIAKIDEDEAFLPIANFQKLLIVVLLAVVFSVAATALAIAKSIAVPVGKLCKDAEVIGSGNFDHKIGNNTKGEVGQLSRAFDAMAANLKNTTTSIECLNKEITERKQAEESLRESEARIRTIIDILPIRIFWKDTNLRYLGCNEIFAKDAGKNRPEELIGKDDFEMNWKEQAESYQNDDQSVIKSGKSKLNFEEIQTTPNGDNNIWLKTCKLPLTDQQGNIIGILGTYEDITERKQAEEAICASEARMRAITDSAQDAILMMDTEGRVSYWNPAAEHILGYTKAEAIGQNLHSFIVPPRYCQTHHAAFPAFKQTGKGAAIGKTLDLEARRKDGTEISVQLSLSAVQINGGWHAVGILRDITERKQAEELLQKTNQQLAEQDRLKSELIDTVSHEMRTPLCIFKNIISNAIVGAMGEVSTKLKENLAVADQEICRLSKIIGDFVDIAEIDKGTIKLRTKQFAMQSAVAKAIKSLTQLAAAKNIRLTVVAPDSELLLDADYNRMAQVLTNLISNAIKFTQADGRVVIRLREIENEIGVEVEDNGIGVAADDISKVFSRFVQIEKQVGAGEHGIGLGLSITKGIVEMHGGRIWVESTPGQGSIFCFMIPKINNSVAVAEPIC